MTRYRYKAHLKNGAVDADTIEAGSKEAAYLALSKGGKMPFVLEADLSGGDAKRPSQALWQLGSLTKPNNARLFSGLAVLLQSGFTIDQAIATMLSDDLDVNDKKRLFDVEARLKEGSSVAEAFAPAGMPADIIALISSGEKSGNLPGVFSNVSERYEQQAKRRAEIQEALLYPLFLIAMMIAAIFILAFYLVPAIEPIFEGSANGPPTIVYILSAVRVGITHHGAALLACVLCIVFITIVSSRAKQLIMNARHSLPFVGDILKQTAVANYLRTLNLLLTNGVPAKDAMRLASEAAPSDNMKRQFRLAEERLNTGSRLHEALAGTNLMNDGLTAQIRIGEESNNLPTMLARAASAIEARQKIRLDRLFKFLTPAITIFLGLVIGVLVTSVMSTLLGINELAIR
ncbi:type II secretion system F family protein [Hoeflea poritis]|uniref:Type II secretion system F family protein n=1 Tax=Hoeflea poritis TaxID=2993659 RepID=A0ABT4VVU3_9HYPH|nr:type II secretion system F family protein [Hoeflea poritis]MDA4848838.1 type II secretion system F family protein [Hoeflea poritis]